MIHDEDEEESGVFAVINKKIDKAKSFPFMSEHSNFSSLKLEQMSATQFEKQSGYELWHRRLGHSSNRNIRDSIKWNHGLEDLKGLTYEEHAKCPSCMIGPEPDKSRSHLYIKSMLIHFHPQYLPLRDITMLWYLLTNVPDTDGSME